MNEILYNKIKNYINTGSSIIVTYSPYNSDCDVYLTITNIESDEKDILFNELESWWYEDLTENYLLPNDIYGGGDFEFIIKDDELSVNGHIRMSIDDVTNTNIFENIDDESKAIMQIMIEGKGLPADDLMLNFEYSDDFQKFDFTSWDQGLKEYVTIPFTIDELKQVKETIANTIKSLNVFSFKFKDGSMSTDCYENILSIEEYWTFNFKLNMEI
jgi:hypothetical protein